jgi:hypothetical protein
MELVYLEDVMKACNTVVGKHGEDNIDLRVLKETRCESMKRIQ